MQFNSQNQAYLPCPTVKVKKIQKKVKLFQNPWAAAKGEGEDVMVEEVEAIQPFNLIEFDNDNKCFTLSSQLLRGPSTGTFPTTLLSQATETTEKKPLIPVIGAPKTCRK